MKIGICSAMAKEIDISLDYIGVDRGIEVLIDQGINPIYAIGDFDSIRDENLLSNLKIERLPTRKDVTDTHAALEYAIDKGYDEVDIYGVTGGRLDHFFGAMCLLEKYLFACNDSYIDIKHAQYQLDNYYLKRDDPLCVSNQVIDGFAYIKNSENIILIRTKD